MTIEPDEKDRIENYSPERIAEFLLGSAVDEESYQEAEAEVRKMGLDPCSIDHFKPFTRPL
jgi:hypothetical protein